MEYNDGSLSYHFYNEMKEFVGTPNMVRKRRMFFQSLNTVASIHFAYVICSGSKAEGLNTPGSDLDIMIVLKSFHVHNDESSIPSGKNDLYLETNDVPAGFAQIKMKQNSNNTKHFVFTESELLLQNGRVREKYSKFTSNKEFDIWERPIFQVHGPCVSLFDETVDILYALPCKSWPDIASNWPLRQRSLEWPSDDLITKITEGKVLLAPIGSKFGSSQDNPNEWRLSFSVAEIMLIHSFNHTQLTCYAILKLILKEIIDKNPATERILCSYFIKTTLFWMIEEFGYSVWQPFKLIQCVRMCLKRLYYLVQHGHCPNYFIPENNMFEGKIIGHVQNELSFLLVSLYSEGVNLFLRSQTLSKYLAFVYESGMPSGLLNDVLEINEVDSSVYPLLHHMDHLSISNFETLESKIYRVVFHIMHGQYSHFEKTVCSLYLSNECKHTCMEAQYNMASKNKLLYSEFRKNVIYLLIGTHRDRMSSWLSLASFLYRHQQYTNVLKISNFIMSCRLSPVHQLIDDLFALQNLKVPDLSRHCRSFVKRHNHLCGNGLFSKLKVGTVFYKSDIFVFDKGLNIIVSCSPFVFACFITFMSFHHMQNIKERQTALSKLQKAFEDVPVNSPLLQHDFLYLNRAFKIANTKLPAFAFPKVLSNWAISATKASVMERMAYILHPDSLKHILKFAAQVY